MVFYYATDTPDYSGTILD